MAHLGRGAANGSAPACARRGQNVPRATHAAYVPNGVTYTYDYYWNYDDPTQGVPPRNERYLTEMRDAFDNTMTFTYVQPDPTKPPRLDQVVQHLRNGQTRTVSFTYNAHERPASMTCLGRTWTYTWADNKTLTAATPPVGTGWAYRYQSENPRLTVTTLHGGEVRYAFESELVDGRLTRLVSARESWDAGVLVGGWSFLYDRNQSRTTVTHGAKETTFVFESDYGHDPGTVSRRETRQDGVLLEAEALDWRASAPLGAWGDDAPFVPLLESSTITRGGHQSATAHEYGWDSLNDYGQPWRTTETGAFERVTQRTFRHAFPGFIRGKLASETVTVDEASFTRSFLHNDQGFLTSATTYGVETTFAPDAFGNVLSQTDADTHTTSYTYEWGVVKNTQTPGFLIERAINPDGTVQSETRGGVTIGYLYDDLGRLRWTTPPVGAAIETRYDPAGTKIEIQRGVSQVTRWLDGFGRVVKTENAVGVVTETQYDAAGRLTDETAPYQPPDFPARWTTWTYDALDRVKNKTNPDSTEAIYGYSGLDVTITNERGHQTMQHWEATGSPGGARLASVTESSGENGAPETTSYSYDALNALTRVVHPNQQTRSWVYNGQHRLASETHPESGTVTYGPYSDGGNLLAKTDAAGRHFEYTYDRNDRLTEVKVDGVATASFTYDAWDRRKTAVTSAVQTTWVYEAGIRLKTRTDVVNGHPFVTRYEEYDDRDNLVELWYPSGTKVQYDYDAANRVIRVSDLVTHLPYAEGPEAGPIRYHPSGALREYRAGNGTTHTLSLDARGRPAHLVSGPLDLAYSYDQVGNVQGISDGRGADWGQTFAYDQVDRLTSAAGVYGSQTFSYDAVGNRIGSGYTYDPATQRLLERTAGGVTTRFTYDANGSLESQQVGANTTSFTYTPDRMVASVTAAGATTSYQYDGDLLRTTKTGAGQTVYTIHDGGGAAAKHLPRAERGAAVDQG